MADEKDVILDEPEMIRQQMEETRSALNDKLEHLERKVTSTVENAASSVTETVEAVKDSVHSSLDSVRELLDIRGHVDRHPWTMIGGSLAVGLLTGWFLTKPKRRARAEAPRRYAGEWAGNGYTSQPAPAPAATSGNGSSHRDKAKEKEASWLGEITSALTPELDKLKGLAIGTVTSLIRDVVADAIPASMKPKVTDVMDHITTKLGGEPISGPVLDHFPAHREEPSFASTCPGC